MMPALDSPCATSQVKKTIATAKFVYEINANVFVIPIQLLAAAWKAFLADDAVRSILFTSFA